MNEAQPTLVALDLETTGLDPAVHDIWEIGAIVRGHRDPQRDGEWRIEIQPRLDRADPAALRISRFYERRTSLLTDGKTQAYVQIRPPWQTWLNEPGARFYECGRMTVARELAELLDGATIIGSNPTFDVSMLGPWLRRHWQAPCWHHRLVDVGALAAGAVTTMRRALGQPPPSPPWSPRTLAEDLGVPPLSAEDRHTALGDARWAMQVYDAVMGGTGG
ncbi:DNA polymerase III epsilon subunit-like protein [Micromonospora sp. Llam0]|uniref:3'-5' exonuclease n=1 Tax=Micromonospora sp. Llam0 TaxID=2485143 RepID=UPI000F9FBEBB|nr:3'-5' exonuclease [Micromonospora sp. Llam0]ROO51444.1 DNA polymerase III epsilon subunit-like protein [Micromonospora sp. Llam0]